jgi:ribose transport system permease protein
MQRFGLLGFMALIFVLFAILQPNTFPTQDNLLLLISSQSVIVVLALAVSLTLRLGDLDLSFGAVATTSGIVFAVCDVQHHWPVSACILMALLFGLLVGVVNAFMVITIGLSSFVATLGSMTVVEGIGYQLAHSQVVVNVNEHFVSRMADGPGGIAVAVLIGWALFLVMWLVYERTPFGRYLLYIGGGRRSAELLGIRVSLIRYIAYAAGGLLYGLAGVVLVGTVASADPTVGGQYLLPPLAAVFLGTTAIQIGRFNALGTMIAIYTLAIVTSGIQLFGASAWVTYVFSGGALIVAVSLARFSRWHSGDDSNDISVTP